MTAAPLTCRSCGRACRARRGGSPRVFCTRGCRTAFHTAARRWAESAIASGMLTIAELQSGDPAACTFLSGAFPAVGYPSFHRWPRWRLRPALASWRSRLRSMQLRELTWGNPRHLAIPEDLAKAACPLLR